MSAQPETPTNHGADSYSMSPAPSIEAPNVEEFTLLSVWRVLYKRRRFILPVTLLGMLVGFFLATRPSTYTASGSLQVRPGSADMYKVDPSKLLAGGDSD